MIRQSIPYLTSALLAASPLAIMQPALAQTTEANPAEASQALTWTLVQVKGAG